MTCRKLYCSIRILFACWLAVAMAAVLMTFQLLHPVRRPLEHLAVEVVQGKTQPGQEAQDRSASFQLTTETLSGNLKDTARHRSAAGEASPTAQPRLYSPHHHISATAHPPVTTPSLFGNSSAFAVTTTVYGMLGNCMFQYASLMGIAHMNGRRPLGSPALNLESYFEVTHVQFLPFQGLERVIEKHFATYDPAFEHLPNENVLLSFYLQSWKYFDAIQDTVKQEFTFKQRIRHKAAQLMNESVASTGRKVRVGIHVRRGDMLTTKARNEGYHPAPASYLFKAMDYMRQKHGDVIFIVVTTDVTWCREKLSTASDWVLADSASSDVHLALLASCDHVIMTVGTYGWWGGYLSGGDVVYYWDPEVMLHDPSLLAEITHPEDFFPPSWVPLPG